MKYREGFSTALIEYLIDQAQPRTVLDPFSGIGTTPLVASGRGIKSIGIELVPVATLAAQAISLASKHVKRASFIESAAALLHHVRSKRSPAVEYLFPHVTITKGAFPPENEAYIAKAREFISGVNDGATYTLLNLACMSVLESVSFTRKDGQYLRWDRRSGKSTAQMQKQVILSFPDALALRLQEIDEDLAELRIRFGDGRPTFVSESSLDYLQELDPNSYDMVITSPPYANRYDYTRTYALELAWLDYNEEGIKSLRQKMLSSTVENKSKRNQLVKSYGNKDLINSALNAYDRQQAVHEVLGRLRANVNHLSNPHIIRMLEGYFFELAVVVAEFGRLVRPGGSVVIVNDNVQYHGEEVPVDLILADFAEQCGFECKHIWMLARGKGNSSQQMKRFGRRELRKCVYWWQRKSS